MDQRLLEPAGTDWRGLCEQLVAELERYRPLAEVPDCLERARAALAEPEPEGHPAPAPAEGEVAELVEWLRDDLELYPAEKRRVADLLEQRQPTPVPVPVSERLPGPEDCDAEGRCWLHLPDMGTEPLWRLTDPSMRSRYHSHWLPATALPLPQGEVEA